MRWPKLLNFSGMSRGDSVVTAWQKAQKRRRSTVVDAGTKFRGLVVTRMDAACISLRFVGFGGGRDERRRIP